MSGTDAEFVFELQVCRWAEQNWPPDGDHGADTTALVARQLGVRRRRWDTIVIEADAEKLAARARFGPDALDEDLLPIVRHAPPEWAWYRNVLPEPDYPWRYVREAVNRAADRGVVETRRDGNRIELRRKWEYPEWIERIVAIENKPDLSASAARDLAPQIERDVALGLADEVWVATRATDESIEPVLFETLPVEAGILVFEDPERSPSETERERPAGPPGATVAWHPRSLDATGHGTRILDRPSGGTHDRSAATFEYAEPAWKARKRRAIAERAYERGWRAYLTSMRPDCRAFALRSSTDRGEDSRSSVTLLPHCAAKGRHQTAAECGSSCPKFEPEPPAWRSRGWPIEGGPGKAIQRLLARRRRRRRPGLGE